MKNLTIWQRLNLAMALLIGLLALGVGFAFWMVSTQAGADRKANMLADSHDRISLEVSRYTAALRGFILAPDKDARKELQDARESLEQALPLDISSSSSLRRDLAMFNNHILESPESSRESLTASYNEGFPPIQKQFGRINDDISAKVTNGTNAVYEKSKLVSIGALVGIGLVLIAALVVARYLSSSMTSPMHTIVGGLENMQRGDFTKRVQMERQDEFGVVGSGLNKLADELSILVGQVQRSGIQVNSTATEISATAREQQSTANEIAATTAEIGATSKEISATSKELVKTMNEVSHVSEETAELAGSGQNAIGKMEATMRQIMDASGSITGKLAVLSEKTANINTVVTTITKVADQTNLLSLNAAIEAEKAGEYGLGFAVVAMEIRRLADQTAVATYDIEKMVKEMQSAVAAGVMGMDKFSEEVRRGVEEVRTVGTQLAQIIHQVQTLTPRFHTVNEGMHAQATGAQQISETLTQLNEAAQLTAESLRQSNIAIEQLNEAAHGLQTAVARFKLKS